MTRPQFSSHAEEIAAARAWCEANTPLGPLVLPDARARYLDRLPLKPQPAPANVRFMARLCLALVAVIAVVLAMIALKGGAV